MKLKRIKELMEFERNCVVRGATCDRNCGKCDLVQDSDELIQAYTAVIGMTQGYINQGWKDVFVTD